MAKSKPHVYVVITQTTGIAGELVEPGTPQALQLLPAVEARNLLDRNRARLATEDDGAPLPDEAPAGPAGNNLAAQLAGMKKPRLLAAAKELGLSDISRANSEAEITAAILAAAAE